MIPTSTAYFDNLVPARGRYPYYIVAPPYTRTSAGVRALHVLCHWLNITGQSAFLLVYPPRDDLQVNPELQTPLLTEAVKRYHFENGLTPIVVYPEVVAGNPFDAPVRVRWIGNVPGLLGGTTTYDPDEICFAHSKHLAGSVGTSNVLFIPVIDTAIYKPEPVVARSGTCFYAAKYQAVHGRRVDGLPEGSVEITRDADKWSPSRIADLFRRSKVFYCFEDTALINEAALCGCPVVMMQNEKFVCPIAVEEVGWDGYAWGNDPVEISRAVQTVSAAYDNYVRNIPTFFMQLYSFVLITQKRAALTPYVCAFKLLPMPDNALSAATWRQALGALLLEREASRRDAPRTELLWTSRVGLASGAVNRVEFVTGWKKAGENTFCSTSKSNTLCIVPPEAAQTVSLQLTGIAGKDQHCYRLIWEDELLREFLIADGETLCVEIAVLEPETPMILTLVHPDEKTDSDRSLEQPGVRLDEIRAKIAIEQEANGTQSPAFLRQDLIADSKNASTSRNCTAVLQQGILHVAASAPDPSIVFNLDKRWQISGRSLFVWGIYETEQKDVLQVFLPSGDGTLTETLSARAAIEAGRHAFVIALPSTESITAIRLDPLDGIGQISFRRLELLAAFARVGLGHERARWTAAPQLARFHHFPLLMEAAVYKDCSATIQPPGIHVVADAGSARPEIFVPLQAPVMQAVDDAIFLVGSSTCDTADEIAVYVPDPVDGTFNQRWLAKSALSQGRGRFCVRLPNVSAVALLCIVPFHNAQAVTLSDLEILLMLPQSAEHRNDLAETQT